MNKLFESHQNEKQKRIEYFDIAKGIGMILVIMGHTGFLSENLRHFVFSFHMPLFFVISGMLLGARKELSQPFAELAKRKFKALFRPYLSFSLIYIMVYIIALNNGEMTPSDMVQNIIYMITLYGDSTLWFLPALFLSEVGFVWLWQRFDEFFAENVNSTDKSGCDKRFLLHKSELNRDLAAILVAGIAGITGFLVQNRITVIWSMNSDNMFITNLIDFIRGFLRAGVAMTFVGVGFWVFEYIFKPLSDQTGDFFAIYQCDDDRKLATIIPIDGFGKGALNRKKEQNKEDVSVNPSKTIAADTEDNMKDKLSFGVSVQNEPDDQKRLENTGKARGKRSRTLVLITAVILGALTWGVSLQNEIVDFHRVVLGNYLLFLTAGIMGSLMVILFSIMIDKMRIFARQTYVSKLLSYLGRNSLVIMCTHLNLYILYWSIQWAWMVDRIVTRAKSYVFMFNILCAVIVLEAILIFVINRYFPFLIKSGVSSGKR